MYTGALVKLRRVDPSLDVEDRYRWMSDPEVTQHLGMRPALLSKANVQKYLEACANESNDMVEFAILTLDGKHIGGCTLRKFDHVVRSAEIGIAIGETGYRGKGYGTDTMRLLCQIGFEQFNLNRISLHVNEENVAGIRAYEKAGFSREGVLRQAWFKDGKYSDTICMAILRSEYESGKGRA